MYLWSGTLNEMAVSTENKALADKLKKWAEGEGYKVTFSRGYQDDGPVHK